MQQQILFPEAQQKESPSFVETSVSVADSPSLKSLLPRAMQPPDPTTPQQLQGKQPEKLTVPPSPLYVAGISARATEAKAGSSLPAKGVARNLYGHWVPDEKPAEKGITRAAATGATGISKNGADEGSAISGIAIQEDAAGNEPLDIGIRKILPVKNLRIEKYDTVDFERDSVTYPESVDKPPIFETHVNAPKLGSKLVLRGNQHSYIGIRTTVVNPTNGKLQRKVLRIGYGYFVDEGNILSFLIRGVPAGVMNDTEARASVSTNTPIKYSQINSFFAWISDYFRLHPIYNYLRRNCNTFTREAAQHIGANTVDSLHNAISPTGAANNILDAASENKDPDRYMAEFDNYRNPNKPPEKGGKRDILIIGKEYVLLPISDEDFISEAKQASAKDMNIFQRFFYKSGFKSEETEQSIMDIARYVGIMQTEVQKIRLEGYQNQEDTIQGLCEYLIDLIKSRLDKVPKSHKHLILYLLRSLNLFEQLKVYIKDLLFLRIAGERIAREATNIVFPNKESLNDLLRHDNYQFLSCIFPDMTSQRLDSFFLSLIKAAKEPNDKTNLTDIRNEAFFSLNEQIREGNIDEAKILGKRKDGESNDSFSRRLITETSSEFSKLAIEQFNVNSLLTQDFEEALREGEEMNVIVRTLTERVFKQ